MLGRMFDAIEFRGFQQDTVETLADWSGVPVYNGLTDDVAPHPGARGPHDPRGGVRRPARPAARLRRATAATTWRTRLLVGCARMGVHVHDRRPGGAASGREELLKAVRP